MERPALHRIRCRLAEVSQHTRNRFEAAVGIVPPNYRNPHEIVPGANRQQQDLNIEHVAVNGLPLEKVPGHKLSEELKTTLRVWKSGEPHAGPEHVPKQFRAPLAVRPSSLLDVSARQRAVPQNPVDSGIAELRHYLIESADFRFVVGVDKTDSGPPGMQYPFADRVPLAAVPLVAQAVDALVPS